MTASLSEGAQRLITEPNIGHVATLMPDGSPQVTPVWIDTDGTHLIFNTAGGRQKTRNLERNARVAVSITDRTNAYSWIAVRGHVVEITDEGAEAHIDAMAKKYLNADSYPFRRDGEMRLIIKIAPDKVSGPGAE